MLYSSIVSTAFLKNTVLDLTPKLSSYFIKTYFSSNLWSRVQSYKIKFCLRLPITFKLGYNLGSAILFVVTGLICVLKWHIWPKNMFIITECLLINKFVSLYFRLNQFNSHELNWIKASSRIYLYFWRQNFVLYDRLQVQIFAFGCYDDDGRHRRRPKIEWSH